MYLFLPFSVIADCIQKIQSSQARAICVVPLWETRSWFSPLMNLLVDVPIIFPKTKHVLSLSHSRAIHPLSNKLIMIACYVSGVVSETEAFLTTQQTPWPYGEHQQRRDIRHIYRRRFSTVVKNTLISFPFYKQCYRVFDLSI